MKKYIKKSLKVSVVFYCIYAICYLGFSFSIWEFKNPFEWIFDIPSYSNENRSFLALGSFIYWFLKYFLIHIGITNTKHK